MASTKPTLSDIAEKSGVSRTAVSMALRNHPKAQSFNPDTVRRIQNAARDLGYRTNFFSSQLRRSVAQVIMVYLDSLQDLYASAIAESFQQQAAKRGYWSMMSVTQGTDAPVFDKRIIGDHGVSAVALMASVNDRINARSLQKLIRDGVHGVSVGRDKPCEGVSQITVDDYRGGWLAAEHVYSLGARNVWQLGHRPFEKISRQQRHDGVVDYASKNNLPVPEFVQCHDVPSTGRGTVSMKQQGYLAVKQRLAQGDTPPDAIITHLDIIAMGVYAALYEAGYTPGKDVAVIGYDDIWPAEMIHPMLTTIHQPTTELGNSAADMLIDSLEGRIRPGRQISLEPELIVRDSTQHWKPRN